MKVTDALKSVMLVAFDTAPIIYFIENHPTYASLVQEFVDEVNDGKIAITGSTLLLTEVLVQPIKFNNQRLLTAYENILVSSTGLNLIPISAGIARQAAQLRATYRLKNP